MNAKSNNDEVKLPSLLAFERKLEVSDALMYSGNWNDIDNHDEWRPIPITKRQNRSTQSAFGTEDSEKKKPNPVASDSDDANLPMNKDSLRVNFTLRVIGNLGKPFACNDPKFEEKIIEKTTEFKGVDGRGLETLALRYAYNIANGRFLWRNRVCAEQIKVHVYFGNEEKAEIFNATNYSMNNFSDNANSAELTKLKDFILKGLYGGDNSFVFLKVNAYSKLGVGQHVFPSQEMNMGEKKKVLFQLGNCAAIHNVKIGNAIRTIDNWYDDAEFPIAVEPFGAVTQIGQAFRKSSNNSLYGLLENWLSNEEVADNDKNYVVANLIRGGLFQGESEKDKAKGGKKGKAINDEEQ